MNTELINSICYDSEDIGEDGHGERTLVTCKQENVEDAVKECITYWPQSFCAKTIRDFNQNHS
jgi:hypothetical protein